MIEEGSCILSFDIGIRNLSWAFIECSTKRLLGYGILDAFNEQTQTKSSTDFGIITDCVLLTLNDFFNTKLNPLKQQQIEGLKYYVAIENQPIIKQPRMKMVQDVVWTFFRYKKLFQNEPIIQSYIVSPYGKLSIYQGETFFDTSHIKTKYKKNKYLAVKYCEHFLCNVYEQQDIWEDIQQRQKQDDISDAYLQGLYQIQQLTDTKKVKQDKLYKIKKTPKK